MPCLRRNLPRGFILVLKHRSELKVYNIMNGVSLGVVMYRHIVQLILAAEKDHFLLAILLVGGTIVNTFGI